MFTSRQSSGCRQPVLKPVFCSVAPQTPTRFQLEKLDRPVINDANRKINSGDWKVIVSGSGEEYLSLKEKIGEPSIGDTGKTEYYGAIELEAEGK